MMRLRIIKDDEHDDEEGDGDEADVEDVDHTHMKTAMATTTMLVSTMTLTVRPKLADDDEMLLLRPLMVMMLVAVMLNNLMADHGDVATGAAVGQWRRRCGFQRYLHPLPLSPQPSKLKSRIEPFEDPESLKVLEGVLVY